MSGSMPATVKRPLMSPALVISIWVLYLLCWRFYAAAIPASCPFTNDQGCCDVPCQARLCEALLNLSRPTHMVDSWHNTAGWLTAQQSGSCAQYLASQPQALPAYCNWFGVGCAQDTQNTSCPVSSQAYRISSIDLSVNNASGSINSSDFLQPLQLLHDCGMTSFKIGGGAYYLTGTLSPQLGRLTNLAQLSFFAANITGTLPPEMGNLARLQQLDLSSNYITGTIPESFGNLTSLTSLNLAFNGWTDIGKGGLQQQGSVHTCT